MRAIASIATAVLLVGAAVTAQTPPPRQPTTTRDATVAPPANTAIIEGTVTAIGTARPVRRARVAISGGDPRIARSVVADDRGGFAFTDLPAGQFTLSASRPGFLDVTYGQKRPGSGRAGTPIELLAGQHVDRVALQMPRGGVITGVTLDEFGDSASGAIVRALRFVRRDGERVLQQAASAQSDDRGVYRISGLFPGEYVVNVTPRESDLPQVEQKMQMEEVAVAKMKMAEAAGSGGPPVEEIQRMLDQIASAAANSDPAKEPASGYAPVYYPGTINGATASIVAVDIGEEKAGIDLQLQVVPLARITGMVTSPDGALPAGTQVILIDGQSAAGQAPRSARVGPDGRFTFSSVPQGAYTLLARSGGAVVAVPTSSGGGGAGSIKITATAPNNQLWAMAEISADSRNGAPVMLMLQPGFSVSGRLTFDGTMPTDLTRVRLSLNPVGTGPAAELANGVRPAGIDADGRFTFVGAVPGRYRLSLASGLTGWSLKSATAGAQDMLDIPIDIKENVTGIAVTATTRTSSLSGTLQGPAGDPASDYTVVIFAADNRFWLPQSRRIQVARPSTTGRFGFRDLPPGDYRLAAVSDVEPGQWYDASFLRQLVGASIQVTLADGEQKAQDLRLTGR